VPSYRVSKPRRSKLGSIPVGAAPGRIQTIDIMRKKLESSEEMAGQLVWAVRQHRSIGGGHARSVAGIDRRLLAGNLQQFDVAGNEIEQESRSGLVTRAAQRPGVDDARPTHQIIGAAQRVAVENVIELA
jgi:hypothetical protein